MIKERLKPVLLPSHYECFKPVLLKSYVNYRLLIVSRFGQMRLLDALHVNVSALNVKMQQWMYSYIYFYITPFHPS